MKAWKKLAALVMALGMTVAFAACGGDDNGSSSNGGSSNGGGNVSSSVDNAGGELVGEEVSQADFEAAVAASYAAMNFTVVQTDAHGTTTSYSADGKVYSVAESDYGISYCYMGAVEDTYYMWTSDDGEYWEWEELEWEAAFNPASGECLLGEILQWCNFTYYSFNEETGMFQFTPFGCPAVDVMISNGKVVKYRIEETQNVWREGVITYGNATVGNLPPVTL